MRQSTKENAMQSSATTFPIGADRREAALFQMEAAEDQDFMGIDGAKDPIKGSSLRMPR